MPRGSNKKRAQEEPPMRSQLADDVQLPSKLSIFSVLAYVFRVNTPTTNEAKLQELNSVQAEASNGICQIASNCLEEAVVEDMRALEERAEIQKRVLFKAQREGKPKGQAKSMDKIEKTVHRMNRIYQTSLSKAREMKLREKREQVKALQAKVISEPPDHRTVMDLVKAFSELQSEFEVSTGESEGGFKKRIIHTAIHDTFRKPSLYPERRRQALERTLEDFIHWLERVNGKSRVYWLWNESDEKEDADDDVLHFLARRLHNKNALATSFFFPDGHKKIWSSDEIQSGFVPTIVWELIRYIPAFRAMVGTVCEAIGAFILGKVMRTQIDSLLIAAFKMLPQQDQRRPLIFVINGLDRCPAHAVQDIFDALEQCAIHLPICFLVSSRKTKWIEHNFSNWALKAVTHQTTHKVDPSVSDSTVD